MTAGSPHGVEYWDPNRREYMVRAYRTEDYVREVGQNGVRQWRAETERCGVLVVTLFVGVNMSVHREGPPIWYETMIFFDANNIEDQRIVNRWHSRAQAIKCHYETCQMLWPTYGGKNQYAGSRWGYDTVEFELVTYQNEIEYVDLTDDFWEQFDDAPFAP